jgi:hypothetical protein
MKFEMTADYSVLGCDAVQSGRNLLPPFHAFKMKETGFSETSQSARMDGVMSQKTVGLIFKLSVCFYLYPLIFLIVFEYPLRYFSTLV